MFYEGFLVISSSCPGVAVEIFVTHASVSSGIQAMRPNREKRRAWTIAKTVVA